MDKPTSEVEATDGRTAEPRIGSYRILKPLGSGGMSSVYHGAHVDSGHEVALKVLTRTLAKNPSLLQRFLREAKSALTLEHPNIVAIYDRGMDQGRHYLVLEYIAGGDYHDHVRRHGPLSVEEGVATIRSVASGLKYASGRGLIHRDIKPSNLLRTASGQVKIIDLGLALHYENEDERVTREGTTVGTVDYMAPEQARDSRATSVQSDIYSLGCTFYYLLTGVAPFPGGDVTDKLTRHATAPPPDVRDLRPDVPEPLSIVLKRMMAKQPRDRFASYDDLLAALDQAMGLGGGQARPPSSGGMTVVKPGPPIAFAEGRPAAAGEGASRRLNKSSQPILDAEIVDDDDDEWGRDDDWGHDDDGPDIPFDDGELELARRQAPAVGLGTRGSSSNSLGFWIVGAVGVAAVFVVLLVGLAQLRDVGAGGGENSALAGATSPESPFDTPAVIRAPAPVVRPPERRDRSQAKVVQKPAVERWREPADPPDPGGNDESPELDPGRKLLPEWARGAIPDRIAGPFVALERVVPSGAGAVVSALHMALDRYKGGTVEIADEGPFPLDDFRMAGDSRLIRAKPGLRPIVRIEAPVLETARQLPALCVLERKSLILDGLDLIVNVRDLEPRQTAFFLCVSSDLTLRNCTVTVVNPAGAPFAFVRAESTAARPSRIRLERTLVRGNLGPGFDLQGGGDLVLHESAVFAGSGPLVRVVGGDGARERRLCFVESLLAGQGPMIELKPSAGRARAAIGVLANETTFGRWQGAGIASVVTSTDAVLAPRGQLDWAGDGNVFHGWNGYFACGNEATVRVENLAAVRSTWSARESGSREIPAPWPRPSELAAASLVDVSPFTAVAGRLASRLARPRAGLFEKALTAFIAPIVPEPLGWATLVEPAAAGNFAPGNFAPGNVATRRFKLGIPGAANRGFGPGATTPGAAPAAGSNELVLDVNAPPWNGDLGRFLRERIAPGVHRAKVRVVGSGEFRSSPVRLPTGLVLEIAVDSPAGAAGLSWAPLAGATGAALIEVQEGLLVLSGVGLRHSDDEQLEHLIRVEDGSLALWRCRLTASGTRSGPGADLIAFRAATTRPIALALEPPLFTRPLDRPTCRLMGSVLITGGTALAAELGRGLVALSDCALAAGMTAIELVPARVARNRFDADLWLDRCTLAAEQALVRARAWPGTDPGPDRPWLISSGRCAFLAPFERKPREGVLLRADADSLAKGTYYWQENDDAIEVDGFIAAGDSVLPTNRTRDLAAQWVVIWGKSHLGRLSGPRGTGSNPTVRLVDHLNPGRVAPEDLMLDYDFHPGRSQLTVGADLARLGVAPKPGRGGRRRN